MALCFYCYGKFLVYTCTSTTILQKYKTVYRLQLVNFSCQDEKAVLVRHWDFRPPLFLTTFRLILPCYVKLWMLEDRRYNMALIWSWHGGLHHGQPVFFKNKITQDIKHNFKHLAMILLGLSHFLKVSVFKETLTLFFFHDIKMAQTWL